ncbi:hypothetical protein CANARDRAFT_26341 [[Candida] arabinofermentans NRRL YB-2248]|uniref:Glycylpeptide N-tetradecanoyltransferase n=1 Tax=[Candida] arabinofermentans NRRL YB-2248 TaxID=983967 RepID=A0A1E4T8W3_9ASCO|nr:hypothetical protein CANARDRAFT_26341 [[Candida] arabinofermentans NRRL YB-2248]
MADKQPSKKTIEDLLKMLAMGEELSQKQKKEMSDYKFWKTQPVSKFDETVKEEGPIDQSRTPDDIPDEPLPMLKDFEWVTMDLEIPEEMDQVYKLLHEHYVEDQDETFRFDYSAKFFEWALKPPGWKKDWHVGVRVKSTGKLVAFISGIPTLLNVRSKDINSVEINFLCIHKKLRDKRLAPVLIKEITRRVNKQNIWQALYSAGVILPSPVATCRYTHRPLNWEKLHDVGFSTLPPNVTKAQMVAKYALPSTTKTKGLRKMKIEDVDQVLELYTKYQARFDMIQVFDKDECLHWFMGNQSQQDLPEDEKVIVTYVVEDESTGKITDFFSFYMLPFSVLNNPNHDKLGIAYLYYYATDVAFNNDDDDNDSKLQKRLDSLINDALILSKNYKVDVFNAVTSQDNVLFLKDLKFGPGDGFLNFYLFNYKAFPINGGIDKNKEYDMVNKSGVGVVML